MYLYPFPQTFGGVCVTEPSLSQARLPVSHGLRDSTPPLCRRSRPVRSVGGQQQIR